MSTISSRQPQPKTQPDIFSQTLTLNTISQLTSQQQTIKVLACSAGPGVTRRTRAAHVHTS